MYVKQLFSRRGATTFVISNDDEKFAVKMAKGTDDGCAPDIDGVVREATVLFSIETLRVGFEPVFFRRDASVVLLKKWITGDLALRDVESLAKIGEEASLINLLEAVLVGLNVLHSAGWAHGDLQPGHFIHHQDRVVLLDYGTAQSEVVPMPNYRGGMVHFNSPETAASILSRGHSIATTCSDIFSLGAVFMFAATGKFVARYERHESFQNKLTALAFDELQMGFLYDQLRLVPRFRDLIILMLSKDLASRPSNASQVLKLVAAAQRDKYS